MLTFAHLFIIRTMSTYVIERENIFLIFEQRLEWLKRHENSIYSIKSSYSANSHTEGDMRCVAVRRINSNLCAIISTFPDFDHTPISAVIEDRRRA